MRKLISKIFQYVIVTTLLASIFSNKLKTNLLTSGLVSIDVAKYSNICLRALMTSLNPNVCVKDDDEAKGYPVIKVCPSGSTEEKGLCWTPCVSGYKLERGLCIEDCGNATLERGDCCIRSGKLIPRKSYFADTVPYESTTSCKEGYYKSNGMCYRDCEALGMHNCGTEICTDKPETCTSTLKNTIGVVSENLHKALEAIANCKTEKDDIAQIKQMIKSELSGFSLEYLKNALKKNYAEATHADKQAIFDHAVMKLKKYCESSLNPFSKLSFLTSYCSTVYDYLLCHTDPESEITKTSLVNSLDVMYLNEKIAKCKETCNGAVTCADNIFSKLKINDATGILALGEGLFYETCEFCVDCEPYPTPSYPNIPNNINPDCVYIYEHSNFGGNYIEYCSDVTSISGLNAQSMISGANVYVIAFHSNNFRNGFFPVGKGQFIASLNDGNYETYGLQYININSIKFMKKDCLHFVDARRTNPLSKPSNHVINTVCRGDNQSLLNIVLNTSNNFFLFKSFDLTQQFKIYDRFSSNTYIINGQNFMENLSQIGFNNIRRVEWL